MIVLSSYRDCLVVIPLIYSNHPETHFLFDCPFQWFSRLASIKFTHSVLFHAMQRPKITLCRRRVTCHRDGSLSLRKEHYAFPAGNVLQWSSSMCMCRRNTLSCLPSWLHRQQWTSIFRDSNSQTIETYADKPFLFCPDLCGVPTSVGSISIEANCTRPELGFARVQLGTAGYVAIIQVKYPYSRPLKVGKPIPIRYIHDGYKFTRIPMYSYAFSSSVENSVNQIKT
jgi:hypothetical protein